MESASGLKPFFLELFEYNRAANEAFITLLNANEKQLNEKCVSLINHIINAHHIWNNRIEKKELAYGVWEIHKFTDLKLLNNGNHAMSKELLTDYSLENKVDYINTKGELFSNSVRDILFHVINHSNYHRAQIATTLKSLGIEPPKSDYIVYKR
ncbi:MAG: damage-inducible protein DinB [Bacteroidia bacterium]|nr:damage-inducible protein DinB [Bacteroidia bacterium]